MNDLCEPIFFIKIKFYRCCYIEIFEDILGPEIIEY